MEMTTMVAQLQIYGHAAFWKGSICQMSVVMRVSAILQQHINYIPDNPRDEFNYYHLVPCHR